MLAPNADSAVAKCISSETVNPDLKGILDIFDDPISRKAKEIEQEIQQVYIYIYIFGEGK